jgi:hypothetical protein
VSALLVLSAIVVAAVSGIPALVAPRGTRHVSTVLLAVASILGLAGAALAFRTEGAIDAPWGIPGAAFSMRVDALSAFFLIPLFVVGFCVALYAEGYWPQSKAGGSSLRFFYGLEIGRASCRERV